MKSSEMHTEAVVAEVTAVIPAASLFHSFSDPNRLVILQHLQLGEHRVVDLVGHLGLSQSTVSKHLACLKDADMVTSRPEGRASLYSLKHPEALVELLSAAEQMLALTGDAVTLCPIHGTAAVSSRT
ncbi:metalloregulator ArsR/SmtB family transcription factor [Leucobacter sp. wl10]|uniref:ArsR/SmtB family transcription factor n=1 Tax=Leucobacter sp. wl10 TaxID=2304677 RepID=UPI001F092DBC|nr:metalloregulator ArsR/SmtB family transcription factor [Leucobacter sp. wl10]